MLQPQKVQSAQVTKKATVIYLKVSEFAGDLGKTFRCFYKICGNMRIREISGPYGGEYEDDSLGI
jgi:hypothetical protein